MKLKKFFKVFVIVFVMVLCLTLTACTKTNEESKEVSVVSIKISGSSQVKLGESSQLKYTLNPATAKTTVTWKSENEAVATVNQDGMVQGISLGIAKIVVTTANGKTATKVVQVKEELDPEYPDLQGYTIRIAHSDNRLYEYDPFYVSEDGAVTYEGLDIEEAQEAWEWVEENFNCTIEVVSYPSDAAWGDARIDYILTQARNNTSQYDLLVITDTWIPELAQGGGLVDLTEWYAKYGNNFMDAAFVTSGTYKNKLYSISTTEASVYPIFGYNINLIEELKKVDNTIEEPAKMFNDDNWDFDTFYEFCSKCQTAMNSLYGEDAGYYAISGWPVYIWIGMCDTSGVGIADVTAMKMHLSGDTETKAADLLAKMYQEGMIDPTFQVDGKVQTWNQGHAIFNTGSEWFVNDSLRWPDDLWGEGDKTRYGYVPYPAVTGTKKADYKLAVTGGQCMAMPVCKDYTGYGEECTTENIYYAYVTYLQLARQKYTSREDYDEYGAMQTLAARKFGSTEAVKAEVYMNYNAKDICYYDPMIIESNPIASTYDSDWAKAILNYFRGTGESTWAETVEPYRDTLEQTLVRVFG